jgi:phage terminase small subunit
VPRELTPRQRRFIAAFQTGVTAAHAAVQAGYSPRSAKHTAYSLMHENALVRAELDKLRQHLIAEAEYNGAKAMADCESGMAFAVKTDNANAYVRAVELKMRLTGLLREKVDITVERVDLAGALAEARERAQLRLRCDSDPTIEGDFVAVPGVAADRPIDSESAAREFSANGPDWDL